MICEVTQIEDRIAAQAARDDRNSSLVLRALYAIPKHEMTAKVALDIVESLQSAFISAKDLDLDGAICELDCVLDALYKVTDAQKKKDQDSLSDAMNIYNPYTDV